MDARIAQALILAAPPSSAGAREALAAPPRSVQRVLLTGEGLGWLTPQGLATLRAPGRDLALCSASARDHGLAAERTPAGVRWSSVATWLAEQGGAPFAVLLP